MLGYGNSKKFFLFYFSWSVVYVMVLGSCIIFHQTIWYTTDLRHRASNVIVSSAMVGEEVVKNAMKVVAKRARLVKEMDA